MYVFGRWSWRVHGVDSQGVRAARHDALGVVVLRTARRVVVVRVRMLIVARAVACTCFVDGRGVCMVSIRRRDQPGWRPLPTSS